MSLKATEVFVPGAYPLHTYVEREGEGLEVALTDALNAPGQVVSLSGPSKSGKTVLVEKVVGRDLLITISGASLRTPEQVCQRRQPQPRYHAVMLQILMPIRRDARCLLTVFGLVV